MPCQTVALSAGTRRSLPGCSRPFRHGDLAVLEYPNSLENQARRDRMPVRAAGVDVSARYISYPPVWMDPIEILCNGTTIFISFTLSTFASPRFPRRFAVQRAPTPFGSRRTHATNGIISTEAGGCLAACLLRDVFRLHSEEKGETISLAHPRSGELFTMTSVSQAPLARRC